MIVLTRASQQAAGYRPEGGVERCGYCRFFVTQGTCNRIIGPVSPRGWCRYFSRMVYLRLDAGADDDFTGGPPGVTLDLNFLAMAPTLDPRITFTRASMATYFNSVGVLQTAATNAPRFDYNPTTRQPNGLLIEEARTNLILQSQFAASWVFSDSGIVGNAQSPDGTASAVILQEGSTASSAHYIVQSVTKPASSVTYAISVYLKAGTGTRNLMFQIDDGGSNGLFMTVNPTTGAIVSNTAPFGTGVTGTPAVYSPGTNGWGRVAFTITTNTTTALRSILFLANGTSNVYNGDNASQIQLYGYQVEQGGFPTSYIPTTSAAVTRSADVATLANIAGRNTAAESFEAEFVIIMATATLNPRIIGGATTQHGMIFIGSAPQAGTYDGTPPPVTTNTLVLGSVAKAASTWSAPNAGNICLNGGTVAGITTMTTGFAADTSIKFFGDSAAGDQGTGYMRRFRYWPRTLSNSELQSVTT